MVTQTLDTLTMMTLDDIAKVTRYTTRQIQNLIADGKIPQPVRIGTRPRWPRQQIMDWIQAGCPPVSQPAESTNNNKIGA